MSPREFYIWVRDQLIIDFAEYSKSEIYDLLMEKINSVSDDYNQVGMQWEEDYYRNPLLTNK